MATDAEILASVRPGKPPANCPVLGTWRLRTYVRERLSDGRRHNQFGEAPDGYIGYAPDGISAAMRDSGATVICSMDELPGLIAALR